MNKTDWDLHTVEGRLVLTRYETPIVLWFLDRWFRVPDYLFDRIEVWLPRTSPITRIPCLLYSWWLPKLIVRRDWTDYDITERLDAEETSAQD